MAEVGTGAAGSQLKRVGNYIAPQVNRGTDRLAAAFSQNRSIKATKENQEDAQLEKRLEGDKINTDDFLIIATGNTNVDDFFGLASKEGVNAASSLYSQARGLDASGDRAGADLLRAQAPKISSSFKNIKSILPSIKEINDGYHQKYLDGKILKGAYERSGIGGIKMGEAVPKMTSNYDWEMHVMVRDSETQKPKIGKDGKVVRVVQNLGNIQKGFTRPYEINEEKGADGELNKILVSLGKSKVDKINGGYIDTDQVWDEKRQNSLNNFIEGTVGVIGSDKEGESGNDREMYKWHKYITGEEKFEDFTDAEKLKISQRIQTGVEGAYNTEQSIKVAPRTAAQISADAIARARERRALSDSKLNKGKLKYSTGSTKTTEGKKAMTFSTKDGFDLSEISFDDFKTGKVLKSTYNVALVDEDGKVFLSNGKDDIELNEAQQVYIANELGLATVEEMLKVAEVKGSKKEGEKVTESNPLGI